MHSVTNFAFVAAIKVLLTGWVALKDISKFCTTVLQAFGKGKVT